MPTTLKEAIKKGKLDEFIKEHEKDEPGDEDKLDQLISPRPAQDSSKSTEETSGDHASGDCDETQTRQDT